MSESLGVGVAVMVREVGLLFRAVVPGQTEETFLQGNEACVRSRDGGRRRRITEVVEVEPGGGDF